MIVLVCLEPPFPGRASRAALDLACTLAGSAQVVAISAGGKRDSQALVLACSRAGLSRAIHLHDTLLDQGDFMTTGTALAEAARKLEASLVIAGERSDDEGQGMVPAVIANQLHANLLSRVQAIAISTAEQTVEVKARAGGQICTLECPVPLVITTPPRASAEQSCSALRVVEPLALSTLGIDPSRMVPRPSLLGTIVLAPATETHSLTLQEAATALRRHG